MSESEKISSAHNFVSFIMTEGDLKSLGMGDVAYIKSYDVKGKTAFVLHAADGSTIDVEESETEAVRSAYQYDLNLVALH